MSIVQSLIDQVEGELTRAGASGRVSRLDLVIGRLSGVHSDSIRMAFQLLSPGTVVEGAELRIDEPPAELVCRDCQARLPIRELTRSCPRCGSNAILIQGGQQLLLQSIDVDDDEDDDGT